MDRWTIKTNHPYKVLIIKTGYTETLCSEPFKEGHVSLGDVLRTTALLHLYKEDKVTWLTDEKAVPLLKGNPYIDRILEFNITSTWQLAGEMFDVVINLEKNSGLCALAGAINAWQKYGFRFDPATGEADAYMGAAQALYLSRDEAMKKGNTKHWLEHLYELVGKTWTGQGYVFRDVPKERGSMVGLNFKTGTKFPGKEWPKENWIELEERLRAEGVTVSYQEGFNDLDTYINWLGAHEVIVTCDSLGLHLAMAMDKRVVGLFGPTPRKEIQPYSKGVMLQAKALVVGTEGPGVWETEAEMRDMDDVAYITVGQVFEAIKELLDWGMC